MLSRWFRRGQKETLKRILRTPECVRLFPDSRAPGCFGYNRSIMAVVEIFFSVEVNDMERATAFYVAALDASVEFRSTTWSSLRIASVRVALFHHAKHTPSKIGLHFVVLDLETACAEVEHAGGRIVASTIEVAPGVVIAELTDTEGNSFTVRQA